MSDVHNRRRFLFGTGIVLTSSLIGGSTGGFAFDKPPTKEEEVTPIEDLAREHGLLNRVLLIYDEAIRRFQAKADIDPRHVLDAAGIIQKFIEQYHERLEEDYLFPRFERAKKLTDLVAVLTRQHQAGRSVTSQVLQIAGSGARDSASREKLGNALASFVRMYRPHEAREDTVLFPAVRSIVSENEYDSLGEEFERKEHQLFGKEGFEGMLDKVASIEKALGIYDLSLFTP